MKRLFFASLTVGLVWAGNVKAQKLEDGINHLYADRYKSAVKVFEGLASNGKPESNYWLAQAYLEMGDNAKAAQVIDNALTSNNNNALLLVAKGQLDLLNNKREDARMKFESALTSTRSKKGDDPAILNAIGRAILDANDSTLGTYAIEKLKTASERDAKNADIMLNLGNAYRRFGGGQLGGDALLSYEKAAKLEKNFPVAYYRIAKLFETQKQYDFVLDNLNKAIEADAKFSPAYYELFYYNFGMNKPDDAKAALEKYIESKKPEEYLEDQSLYAQLCWFYKDYDCAIAKAKSVVDGMGAQTKPNVLKLLADAYLMKKDAANAKKYIDQYFVKQDKAEIIGNDYILQGDIYAADPATASQAIAIYKQAADAEEDVAKKVKLLDDLAKKFNEQKAFNQEGAIREKILEVKPTPTINDIFYVSYAYFQGGEHSKSRDVALTMIEKFPDQIYGYDMAYNNSKIMDTVAIDSIAAPDAIKLMEFAQKDTVKYSKEYVKTLMFLAPYYINVKKDAATSLEYFIKWQANDSVNAAVIQNYIDQLRKIVSSSSSKPANNSSSSGAGGNK